MERDTKNNIGNNNIDTSLSDERLESLAASEMADRGPKAIDTTNNDWPNADGKSTLMGVSNPGRDKVAGDDDLEDDDDDIELEDDDIELDVATPTENDTTEIDDTDIDEDDLDITLDDEEEEEEDI
jgi:hypothetical protein